MEKIEDYAQSILLDQFDHLDEILQVEDISETNWQCVMIWPFDHFLSEEEDIKCLQNMSKNHQKLYANKVDTLIKKILNEYKYYIVNYDGSYDNLSIYQEYYLGEGGAKFHCNRLGDTDLRP
nr:hypothetical protein [uncultured Cohaesibacter sp.]